MCSFQRLLGYLQFGKYFLQPTTECSILSPGTRLSFNEVAKFSKRPQVLCYGQVHASSTFLHPLGRGSNLRERNVFPLWINGRRGNWPHSNNHNEKYLKLIRSNHADIHNDEKRHPFICWQRNTQWNASMHSPRQSLQARHKTRASWLFSGFMNAVFVYKPPHEREYWRVEYRTLRDQY